MFDVKNFLSYNGLDYRVLRSDDWNEVIECRGVRIVTAVKQNYQTIGDCLVTNNWIDGRFVAQSDVASELIDRLQLDA